ncbi:Chromatin associated protein KTI12 [Trichostrongylus colubriformis]|uniref:Protein KTI12 homolog n=1 Tax=Trichostrongylus colubriformis TaxID=6319 RepID=A0AAN8F898_TRICO
MPFLLVTGHPASGKSTIVERIQEYFLSKGKEVVIVRDDDYPSFSRDDYGNSMKEKEQRSFLRSCVQKSLTQNDVVICDGLNYIKGYRYELFLIGKLCKTTFAVIYCHAEESVCKWLNEQKNGEARYNDTILKELIARYEKPDPPNRWDSPLFDIKIGRSEKCPEEAPDDMHLDLEHPSPKFVDIPLSEIFSWMCEGKALTQNQSTQVVPTAPINFLHEIDRVTQEVTSEIIQGQRNAVVGHHIVVTAFDPDPNKVIVKRPRTLAELTRLRRQFISMSKSSPIDSKSKIASLFIHYLNTNG